MKVTKEIESLFKKCRSALGAPLMEVELLDEQLCDLLELSIEDYAEKVQNWMIENQWATLYGRMCLTQIWHMPFQLGLLTSRKTSVTGSQRMLVYSNEVLGS